MALIFCFCCNANNAIVFVCFVLFLGAAAFAAAALLSRACGTQCALPAKGFDFVYCQPMFTMFPATAARLVGDAAPAHAVVAAAANITSAVSFTHVMGSVVASPWGH